MWGRCVGNEQFPVLVTYQERRENVEILFCGLQGRYWQRMFGREEILVGVCEEAGLVDFYFFDGSGVMGGT